MPRADLSNDLVHWIKAPSDDEAFAVLCKILRERQLLGGTGFIKGGFRCVCFTEAPTDAFHQVIGRYRPFGVQIAKKWLFSQGGRPVIYQREDEYNGLEEAQKWRHVTYEPDLETPVDFSWEREWRILTETLELPHGEARIVVPRQDWLDALHAQHFEDEEYRIELEASAYGDEWRMQDPEPYRYHGTVINI